MTPRHPNVRVKLIDQDGNAFAILGRVTRELRRASIPRAEIDAFTGEAMAGNYDHLLQTVCSTVEVL